MLNVSAENAEDDSVDVTVTVKERVRLTLVCTVLPPVYEGARRTSLWTVRGVRGLRQAPTMRMSGEAGEVTDRPRID